MLTPLPTTREGFAGRSRAQHIEDHIALHKLYNKEFNVIKYGGIGDGVSNDTSAIADAYADAATNGGGEIHLPAGIWNVTALPNIISNNISITGDGPGATTIRFMAGSEAAAGFVIGDGINTCAHTRIANLLITSVNQKTANAGIKLQMAFKTYVENVRIENQYRALHVYNSTETWLTAADIRNTKENGIVYESALNSGYDLYLTNVVADNPDLVNTGIGLLWLGGENLSILNCDILRFANGFVVAPPTGQQCRWGFFTGAEFDSSLDNNLKISSSGGDIIGLKFTNTWTGTAGNYGVLIDAGSGGETQALKFIGHTSNHNGLSGMRIAGGLDINLIACEMWGNSQTTPNARSGIEVTSGMANSPLKIIGCTSKNGAQQGNTQSYGLNFDTATYANVQLTGNNFIGNSNGGVNLNGSTLTAIIEEMESSSNVGLSLYKAGQLARLYNDGNTHLDGGGNNVWLEGGNIYMNAANGGKVGVGHSSPTARLHLAAGSASAQSAPIKLTSGTLMSTPEDGAFEYSGGHLYFTIGSTRLQIV